MTHDGIKVILRGQVVNKSRDVYFGASKIGLMGTGQIYEFIQLVREVEGPGQCNEGTFDFSFQFKNVDLMTDSYNGISLEVVYTVTAEMVYQGSMIKYPVKDSQTITVQNNH